jgi:hypothetical protein
MAVSTNTGFEAAALKKMIEEMIKLGVPGFLTQPARRWGKSAVTNQLIQGFAGQALILDEFNRSTKFKIPEWGLVATFETAKVPNATIKVFEVDMDPKDPRNPNPQHRRGAKEFIIKCGDRRIGGTYKTLAAAKMKAKAVHEEMVAGIYALRQKRNPNYARF